MSVSANEVSAHSDEDHGLRDIDALLVVAHEAAPPGHRSEGAFDDLSTWQHLEALLIIGSMNDLDNEVEVVGLAHEFEPVIGGIGEEVLHQGQRLRIPSRIV